MPDVQDKFSMVVLPLNELTLVAGVVMILLGVVLFAVGRQRIRQNKQTESPYRVKMTAVPKVYEYSSVGKRNSQQDACLSSNTVPSRQIMEKGVLAVVCDGMGGMESGELASRACSEQLLNGYYEQKEITEPERVMKRLIKQADQRVARLSSSDGRVLKSGTTVVAAVVKDGSLFWASAGDSRIYLYQEGQLLQLTRDHNFRALLMEQHRAGKLSLEDVEKNPQKNALVSYVGKGGDLTVDTGKRPFKTENGDILVLCSDGLYKALTQQEIQNVVQAYSDNPGKLPEVLVSRALENRRIRHDNITVMVLSK